MAINLTQKVKEKASPCASDGVPGSGKRSYSQVSDGIRIFKVAILLDVKSDKTVDYRLTY